MGRGGCQEAHGRSEEGASPEFTRPARGAEASPCCPIRDTYAAQTGFVNGFPAARESASGAAWMVHCYGMVGARSRQRRKQQQWRRVVCGRREMRLDRLIETSRWSVACCRAWICSATMPRGKGAMGFYRSPKSGRRLRRSGSPLTCRRSGAYPPAGAQDGYANVHGSGGVATQPAG